MLAPHVDLLRGEPRSAWLFTAGMGSELVAFANMEIPLKVIYCVEIDHARIEVLMSQASQARPRSACAEKGMERGGRGGEGGGGGILKEATRRTRRRRSTTRAFR